ncbi:type II toxin-antitoxin system HipA family toxin [Oleiagrimonas sp.]|jgi:serine/threonine-protein kinase HipA|uniref:type II toxin-antitoxin system HipA family toxin n=1 Tax=Oleiagrimonas sp. TaxID=2010330 RepID=UPI002626B6C5|nr:type II toxin-antitoxin system HipA family toxin [Oleiagrimonas sp.]MDA3915287.1 type II toxin-antitoxin system HipA family toxin [Oleiagrimonas sp.]
MLMVRYDGDTVGRIDAREGRLVFRYAAHWLQRRAAFALSTRLPLREAEFVGEEVLGFFANLLPEGPVLDTLCRLRRLPRANVYRLLEAFGRESAGAFEIIPDEDADSRREAAYQPYSEDTLRSDLEALRDNIPLLQQHGALHLSMAGAQNKMPVRSDRGELSLPMGGAPSTHLLKPALQPARLYPESVYNEALCMRLAQAVGLSTASVEIVEVPEPVLLITRFDRLIDKGRIRRLHQLDFCQLAGVLPDQKYEVDGGPGVSDVFALVDAHSALPARDRLQLVDWLVFNYLIGNADAHAKNIAMLFGDDGRWQLAPAYDLISTAYWPALADKMAMAIGGERRPKWLMGRHWQRMCASVGLNFTQFRRRAMTLLDTLHNALPEVARDLPLDDDAPLVKHLHTIVSTRGTWLRERMDQTGS